MQIVIDIPEWLYDSISEYPSRGFAVSQLESAILHGTPISDNATNGDVIKAIFDVKEIDMCNTYSVHFPGEEDYSHYFFKEWWNAPYQKGGKE